MRTNQKERELRMRKRWLHNSTNSKRTMRKLFFLISGALFYQCTNNHSTAVNDRANQFGLEKKIHCIKEGGETFPFFFDDFSSEGAEGNIFFENDTLIGKIQFSYATSMVYTEQEYWFTQNKLIKYKQTTISFRINPVMPMKIV